MANEKTILLSGTEREVKISGQNCDIRNDTVDIIYASRRSPVVAGEDGVISIPAGQAVKLLDTGGTVHLLGTGSVMLCGNDYAELVFKCAPAGGGGGTVDTEARNAITALSATVAQNAEQLTGHADDVDIHLTAEKAIEAAATAISNPNHLINPNFKINQRGQTEYTGRTYGVDNWLVAEDTLLKTENGIKVEAINTNNSIPAFVSQTIENVADYAGRKVALSCLVSECTAANAALYLVSTVSGGSTTYNGKKNLTVGTHAITVDIPDNIASLKVWLIGADTRVGDTTGMYTVFKHAKLEFGGYATPFIPPEAATELMKCQRYYQIHSTGDIDSVDLRPSMAEITDIIQRGDGNYAYIAEL